MHKLNLFLTAEHILNIISIVHFSNQCHNQNKNPIEEFFKAQLNQIFAFTEYAPWKAFLGKYLNVICTFVWTFMDVFVMTISIGVASKFRLLNDELMQIKGEVFLKMIRCSIVQWPQHFIACSIWRKNFGRYDGTSIEVCVPSVN